MQCNKCHSPRIIRFLDGFGHRRVFCRSCQESIVMEEVIQTVSQRRLLDFSDYYSGIPIR